MGYVFTDTYPMEDISDAFYMVKGKNITVGAEDIQIDGANPSAEEAPEEGGDATSTSGVDVVLFMRLQETGFASEKDFLLYLKGYLKSLKEKLQESNPDAVEKLPGIQKPLQDILKNYKDLQFFTGESMNPDGMVVIMDYKDFDGEERPVLYFPKYGLQEEKL
ncbi:translationally-controlled tumor protein homolog [Hyalella azteca]|uniref:Translationally-controlled tumor protein homolog n=1 Tax=Hyalella azteca TaxID=294128 RepID=A0A8B7N0J7_HYAAZ|nr:translationally-controlled tumor protein homolog [Hyalella azteca]